MPNKKIKFAFFGTSDFASILLEELKSKYQIEPDLIVTMPDQPKGRKMVLTPPPVKVWAVANNIPILQPNSLKGEDFIKKLGDNWDVFVVAAYGKIIPNTILEIPKHSSLNIHPSLLPKYRGASPLQFQILHDEKNIGVSIIKMDEEVDHGPIVGQEVVVQFSDLPHPYRKLEMMLAETSAKLLAGILEPWVEGKIEAQTQNHTEASFTRLIKKEDGLIKLDDPSRQNYLKYLAYESWPGIYFFQEKKGQSVRLLIKEAHLLDGQFIIKRVVPEGKKEMDYEQFLKGL